MATEQKYRIIRSGYIQRAEMEKAWTYAELSQKLASKTIGVANSNYNGRFQSSIIDDDSGKIIAREVEL